MSSRDGTILGYLVVLATGVVLQISSVRAPDKVPSLGRVFTHVMHTRTGRVGMLVAWGWVGLHFFAR
jgi:Family of unknown function (DUF6186)